ncbi:phage tail protein, partial [Kluyvera sichuanensis]
MSLTLLASNNASTVLASSINASATTLTVNTGAGSLFPSPVSGTSFFKLTLVDAATGQLTEIVHVTARAGDVMTIERAQEGTAARVWSANDIAANMMTAGTLSYILGNFQPLDATLTALAALIGAADKLPYFNGPDTATLTALTGVGRDIIGKTTVAEVLSYLGLGTAAQRNVGTGANQLPDMSSFAASDSADRG